MNWQYMVRRSNFADAEGTSRLMSAPMNGSSDNTDHRVAQLAPVAERLIARLADRAAYATGEEYDELRSLMTSLRALLPTH